MQHLSIEIKDSPEVAPNYGKEGGWKGAVLKKAIIVKNGTISGAATIDLQFEDEHGNKYVAMVTAALLKGVTDTAN